MAQNISTNITTLPTVNITTNISTNFNSTFLYTFTEYTSTTIYTFTGFVTTIDSGEVTLFGLEMVDIIRISIILGVLILICIIICCVFRYRKYKEKREKRKDINNIDEIDEAQAKIDAFHVHMQDNKLARHSVQTAYNPNPLRVRSKSDEPPQVEMNKANPRPKALTVGDVQKQMQKKQQKQEEAAQIAHNPPQITIVKKTSDDKQHLAVNLFEEEDESLRTLELSPGTPTGAREDSNATMNTMVYVAPDLTVLTPQVTANTLADHPSEETDYTNDTPTVHESNDTMDTFDIPPVQVVDTLTTIIQQHQSEEIGKKNEDKGITPLAQTIPDALTLITEDDGKDNVKQ